MISSHIGDVETVRIRTGTVRANDINSLDSTLPGLEHHGGSQLVGFITGELTNSDF